MHHFFDALQNTTGDAQPGYFARLLDPVSQAVVDIYADDSGTPIISVSGVANMAKTDSLGNLDFYVIPGSYTMEIYAPDAVTFKRRILNVAMNSEKGDTGPAGPVGSTGPSGPSNNTRATLADLKAASTGDVTSLYDGAVWTWTPGDFTGQADDINIVKANSTALSVGAWVRQKSDAVSFQQAGTGAVTRTVQDKARDRVSAKDFGATGNGTTIDQAAVQAFITASGQITPGLGKAGYIPFGQYRLSSSLQSSQFFRIHGDGPRQSVLDNEANILSVPAIDVVGGIGFATYEDLGARGYRNFFRCSGDTDGLTFRNMHLLKMSEAGFEFNGMLQTSEFHRIEFEQCKYGILSTTTTANAITVTKCDFKDLTDSAIKLAGVEDFLVTGCRFEGNGGSASNAIISVDSARLLTFVGGYFEGAQGYALKATNSAGVISFIGTHFTWYSAGVPYKWDVDANCRLVFENCHSTIAMRVPAQAMLVGYNYNFIHSQYAGSLSSPAQRPVVAGAGPYTQDIIQINRPDASNTPLNTNTFVGTLKYTASYADSGGGTLGLAVRQYRVVLRAAANGAITIALTSVSADDGGSASSVIAVAPRASPTATDAAITVTWTGVNPATIDSCAQSFTLEWEQSCTTAENTFGLTHV